MSVGWVGSWVMKMDLWTTLGRTDRQNCYINIARQYADAR